MTLVAMIDRAAEVVITMTGEWLPVRGWANGEGELGCAPAEARFCSAGPDEHGSWWTIDCRHLRRVDRR